MPPLELLAEQTQVFPAKIGYLIDKLLVEVFLLLTIVWWHRAGPMRRRRSDTRALFVIGRLHGFGAPDEIHGHLLLLTHVFSEHLAD